MNPTNSQFDQSNSENYQPLYNLSQSYFVQAESSTSNENAYHVTDATQTRSSDVQQAPVISTPCPSANQIQPVHPSVFFYRPPNDFCQYYVKCKEAHYDNVACLLSDSLNGRNVQFNENEFIFFHLQQHNNRFYQVSCEIVPHLLINNCLNKHFLGVELQQDMGQEHLTFTYDQKKILEYHLKQYLSSQRLLN